MLGQTKHETGKYLIVKWDDVWPARGSDSAEGAMSRIVDHGVEGFVLRPSDIFGPAALWAYAHLIQTAVELGQMRPGVFTDEEYRRLVDSALEVAQVAEDWQRRGENRKVPD